RGWDATGRAPATNERERWVRDFWFRVRREGVRADSGAERVEGDFPQEHPRLLREAADGEGDRAGPGVPACRAGDRLDRQPAVRGDRAQLPGRGAVPQ